MPLNSIIAVFFLISWYGTAAGSEIKNNVSVCECLKIGKEDPLLAACKDLYDSFPRAKWSAEADACKEKEMRVLADHIQECTEIVQEFIHPWTGHKLTRSITGMKNGTCHYIVNMPQGGKMECRFPPDRLDDIAYYYNNSTRFEKAEVTIVTTVVDGKTVTKNRYFIDGEEVTDPMQESLDNGECVTYIPEK